MIERSSAKPLNRQNQSKLSKRTTLEMDYRHTTNGETFIKKKALNCRERQGVLTGATLTHPRAQGSLGSEDQQPSAPIGTGLIRVSLKKLGATESNSNQ